MRNLLRNTGVRILLATVVFTIALAVFIVVISSQGTLLQGSGIGFSNLGVLQEDFDPGTLEEGVDLYALLLSMKLTPPGGAGEESSLVTVALDDFGYYLYDKSEADADSFCLDQLVVAMSYPTEGVDGELLTGINLLEGLEPICSSIGNPIPTVDDSYELYLKSGVRNASTHDLLNGIYTQFPTTNQFLLYPYDLFKVGAALQISYRVLDGDEVLSSGVQRPAVVWLFDTSGDRNWNIEITAEDAVKSADSPIDLGNGTFDAFNILQPGDYQRFSMAFNRPLLFRLAYPFLILAMLAIIGLVPFIEALDGLMEVTAAILFGIFGLKQVMAPGESQGQTLLDAIFIGLYIVLAFTLLLIILTRISRSIRKRRVVQ